MYDQHGVKNGYEVIGEVARDTQVGLPFAMLRHVRNGVGAIGFFNTSAVKEIKEVNGKTFLSTENSIYLVEAACDDTTKNQTGTTSN